MKRRPAETVFELCVARLGLMKGPRLAAYISTWAMASDELGKPIDAQEYAVYWEDYSQASSFRRLAEFRQLFPTLGSPQAVADLAKLVGVRPSEAAHLPLRGDWLRVAAASPSDDAAGRTDRPAGPRRSPRTGGRTAPAAPSRTA